ncbi:MULTISPECIES: CesT family type III secretion system chaperone [unclassified Pseudomonas]|uniref:CesT family type III secretion system chaperone n=1 Tax=unclassified Pseudomonas TaxID=196821 RepID=UPI00385C76CD
MQYETLMIELNVALSLPKPEYIQSVSSFRIGEDVFHVTEHPADYVLMFATVEPSEDAPVIEQNIFSQDPCRPVLGKEPQSNSYILWNRQPIAQLGRAQIHYQLEQLAYAANQLAGKKV